jgi:hypothetical protein
LSRTPRRSSLYAAALLALPLLPLAIVSTDAGAVTPASHAKPTKPARQTVARGAATSAWTPVSARPRARLDGNKRTVNPGEFKAYTLDDAELSSALASAPLAGSRSARRGGAVEVVVPAPTGELATFSVVESPTMQARLQAQHPDIRTYVGNEATTGDSISLVETPTGVHASVRGDHPSWYVDPAYQNDDSLYLSYFGNELPAPEKALVEPKLPKSVARAARVRGIDKNAVASIAEGPDGIVKQRVFRLALLTDNTYAEYVAPGLNDGTRDAESNTAVLAAKTLLMARVNQVYNDDLAVR